MSGDGMAWPAEAALAAALLDALRADADVQALLGNPARIYDGETEEPVFPFVELERHETSDRGSSMRAGQAHTLTLGLRARFGGRQAAKQITGTLRKAADAASLTMAGQRVVLIQTIYTDVMRTPDLREFRGIVRIRIITEEAT